MAFETIWNLLEQPQATGTRFSATGTASCLLERPQGSWNARFSACDARRTARPLRPLYCLLAGDIISVLLSALGTPEGLLEQLQASGPPAGQMEQASASWNFWTARRANGTAQASGTRALALLERAL